MLIKENKKNIYNYQILETIEAGVVLSGPEVKSTRAGQINLKGAYIHIDNNLFATLKNSYISPYKQATTYQKKMQVVAMIEAMATYAPAMGLVGTIIGLVNMMDSLGDRAGLGPALSVALLTTLYGAILAHLVFAPVAGKIRDREEARARVKRLTLEAVISLSQEENPILFKQRLKSFRALREPGAA